jgi:hypothetical protein
MSEWPVRYPTKRVPTPVKNQHIKKNKYFVQHQQHETLL